MFGRRRSTPERPTPRLPTLDRDGWTLRSGEASHAAHPDTFHLPPRALRENLRRGHQVKVILDFEGVGEDGTVAVQGERMNLVVSEKAGARYIGLLLDQPQLFEPEDYPYLRPAVEVPFGPEHVIEVTDLPRFVRRIMFSEPPEQRWA